MTLDDIQAKFVLSSEFQGLRMGYCSAFSPTSKREELGLTLDDIQAKLVLSFKFGVLGCDIVVVFPSISNREKLGLISPPSMFSVYLEASFSEITFTPYLLLNDVRLHYRRRFG